MEQKRVEMVFEPISLGFTCEVKYQLSRELYFRKFPDGSEFDFRRMLFTPELGSKTYPRHLFDWQITPFEALIAYLETDFLGVYERADFVIDDASQTVVHRTLGTRHPHEFKAAGERLVEADIDRSYLGARDKFEHLAARFRQHLTTSGPYLYVFRQIRIYDDVVRLADLLKAANPDHAFKILFVDIEGSDQWLNALEGLVYRGWLPEQADKPAGREWEGDDQRWASILAPFQLTVHGADQITRTFDEAQGVVGDAG